MYQPNDEYKQRKGMKLYAIWDKIGGLYLKIPDGSQYEIGENDKKIYEDGDKYIAKIIPQFSLDKKGTNIQKGTTVQEFKSNIETNATTIEIKDKDGSTLGEEDLVGTGAMLHLSKDGENIDIAISVIGDLNGDGKITATDVSEELIAYSKGKRDKTGETAKQYFTSTYPSATLNIDGEVIYKSSDINDNNIGSDINDLSTIKLIYGLATGKTFDSSSGINTIKLWRGGI